MSADPPARDGEGKATPEPAAIPPWALPALLALAAVVRVAHWLAVRRLPFVDTLVVDSAEYDRWARALLLGSAGDQPFFQPPLYPWLLSLLYRVAATPQAAYLAQIALALVGIWCLFHATRQMAGSRPAIAAAGLAALYGPFVFHDVQLLKESLAVDLAAALLWALAVARGDQRRISWLLAGGVLGVLALLRENALLTVPLLSLLALERRAMRRSAAAIALFLAGVAVPLLPVAAINARRGGGFLPTTWQGGVNLYIGNHEGADGTYRPLTTGRQTPELERQEPWRLAEAALGRRLVAAEVSAYWRGRAVAWAREHPGDFLRLALRKLRLYFGSYEWPDAVDYYWIRQRSPLLAALGFEFAGLALLAAVGLAAATSRGVLRRLAPAWLFALAWVLSVVPFFLFSRYRLPGLVPFAALAGVALVAPCELRISRRRSQTGIVLAAGLALVAWGLPRLAMPGPRLDLVSLNLGRLAEARGDLVEAEREWRQVLAFDPGNAQAHLELGTLAARAGRYAEARELFAAATELAPGSPEAWANLGAAASAVGEPVAARRALDRALALDARFVPALVNRVLAELAAGDLEAAASWQARLFEVAPEHPLTSRLAERIAAARGRSTR